MKLRTAKQYFMEVHTPYRSYQKVRCTAPTVQEVCREEVTQLCQKFVKGKARDFVKPYYIVPFDPLFSIVSMPFLMPISGLCQFI